ncbi:MAG TPA: 2-oxoacid:acceptor oxidoreductase subunit alpha [Anaeromyxobacteraceae bacterium]|nr:2-oxoacid:acceptor oxidoreductase subunit alpha [Anaeromyxobacteraceae bacterium]
MVERHTGPVVNDMSIQVATVNGSGSQSANSVLLRTIFGMGVPVSGKNLFPSNIAGLPTWYTVRACRDGWIARKKETDLLVAMNPETAREDVAGLPPGAAVVYDEPLGLAQLRTDLVFYPVPFDKLAAGVTSEPKLKKLLRNMAYVGVLARLLDLELPEVERAIGKQFGKKAKAVAANIAAARAGWEHAEGIEKRDPYRIQRMDATRGKILIDGNAACAMGAMFGGVTVVTWYPITPSTSLVESLTGYLRQHRIGPDGRATFAVVQAEDELAAVGMAIGAGWAGARAMTATSGPGISLMGEFAGMAYFTEVPAVIFDVQRVGPSTGLPTRTSQGDVLSTALLSHGDTQHVLLLPATVEECFSLAAEAFDLAERLQTPVFVLSDLDLGMNVWMAEPFAYPGKPMDRGKVLGKDDLDRLGGFARYRDVDGDGIAWRTIPGTDHPAASYFARGTGHDDESRYSERADDWERNLLRLRRKMETARGLVPAPVAEESGRELAILAYGSSHHAVVEARDQLRREHGIDADYLRVRAYPFSPEVRAFVARHDRVYVVEQNRDAQLATLLRGDLPPEHAARIRPLARITGLPLDARTVTDAVAEKERA